MKPIIICFIQVQVFIYLCVVVSLNRLQEPVGLIQAQVCFFFLTVCRHSNLMESICLIQAQFFYFIIFLFLLTLRLVTLLNLAILL
jgi:hypothetical protein